MVLGSSNNGETIYLWNDENRIVTESFARANTEPGLKKEGISWRLGCSLTSDFVLHFAKIGRLQEKRGFRSGNSGEGEGKGKDPEKSYQYKSPACPAWLEVSGRYRRRLHSSRNESGYDFIKFTKPKNKPPQRGRC